MQRTIAQTGMITDTAVNPPAQFKPLHQTMSLSLATSYRSSANAICQGAVKLGTWPTERMELEWRHRGLDSPTLKWVLDL